MDAVVGVTDDDRGAWVDVGVASMVVAGVEEAVAARESCAKARCALALGLLSLRSGARRDMPPLPRG